MFRSKKGAQSTVEEAAEAAETMAEAPAETELPKAPPRRALPPDCMPGALPSAKSSPP